MNNIRYTVPEGYRLLRRRSVYMAVREGYEDRLEQWLDAPEHLYNSAGAGGPAGRGAVPVIALDEDEKLLVRKYRRGGIMRYLLRDRYIGSQRPFRELRITAAAAERGVPTATILAAVSMRATVFFYRGYLLSRELGGCLDVPEYIRASWQGMTEHEKEEVINDIADAVRLMHDRGIRHGDLNLKNILIDKTRRDRIFIIDWDKSVIKDRLHAKERRSNIVRLCRSMKKFIRQGLVLSGDDIRRLLESYWKDPHEVERCLSVLNRQLFVRSAFRKR